MNLVESQPDSFRAGFAIALAGEKSAQARDQAQHLVEPGRDRLPDVGQQIRATNFIGIEEQSGIQIGATAAHVHQMDDSPGHHQKQRQRALEPFDRAQLQRLDPATVLQHVEQDLDFPARPIPVDQFNRFLQRRGFAVGQQAPFDRLDAASATRS